MFGSCLIGCRSWELSQNKVKIIRTDGKIEIKEQNYQRIRKGKFKAFRHLKKEKDRWIKPIK